MDNFLRDQSRTGQWDSEGEFQLDLGKALRKLASHQLRAGYCLLSLMQGIHLLEPASTKITHGYRGLEIVSEGISRHLTSELWSDLLQDTPESYLGQGIRAALASEFQEVEVTCAHSGEGTSWVLNAQGRARKEILAGVDGAVLAIVLKRKPSTNPLRWFRTANRPLRDEHALLSQRLAHFSSPLFLDGRRLDGTWGQERPLRTKFTWREGFVKLPGNLKIAEAYLKGDEALVLPFPEARDPAVVGEYERSVRKRQDWDLDSYNTYIHLAPPEGPWCAALAIPWGLTGKSFMSFVRNGVLLDPQQIDLPCPGAYAHVRADTVPVDASGFKVVDNEEFRALVERLREKTFSLNSLMKHFSKEIVKFNYTSTKLLALSLNKNWSVEMSARIQGLQESPKV